MKQLGIVFLCLLLFSCNQAPDSVVELLQSAENCMEAHPDSALAILQKIPHPEKLQGKNQADYGILMTQAIDKNYLPLESDSLIQIAISYYDKSTNNVARGKAYLYYGRYLYEAKRHNEALDIFLKSKNILDGSGQYKLLGLLSTYIGRINMQKHWYDGALLDHRSSLKYYELAKDTLSMTYALSGIGRVYLFKEEFDSAFFYCTSAFKIASEKGLKSEPTILHDLGIVSRLTGDYDKAESYILDSMDKTHPDDVYLRYLSLGVLYFSAKKYDKAEEYLEKSLINNKLEALSKAYTCLYEINILKENYTKGVFYIEKRDSIRSLILDAGNQRDIVELQEKYSNEQLKNENLQFRIALLLGVIFLLIVLIIAVYYYFHSSNTKRRMKDIEFAISQNQREIENYRNELTKYSTSEAEQQSAVGELMGKISLLTNQNRDLTERLLVRGYGKTLSEIADSEVESYVIAFRTLLAIKNGTLSRKLSEPDFDLLMKLFNFLYDGYIDRLNSNFPGLTKHELEMCCLLKLKLSNKEVSDATNTAQDSVRKAKFRLKMSLGVPTEEDLDEFLANY